MKKIMAMMLCLALLLSCAAGGAEETARKQNLGTVRVNGEFTLKGIIPEGYRVVPFEQSDEAILSRILSDDPAKPEMVLSIAYDEIYGDVKTLNDLDGEALAILEKTFTDTDPYADITYDETNAGTRLLVCRTLGDNYDYLDIFSIYEGYLVEFVIIPGETAAEQKLTESEIAMGHDFLSELDFVLGVETEALELAGNTFLAEISGFDTTAKTIDAALLTPYTLTEWQIVSIREGDTIQIGPDQVVIEVLTYEEEGVVINDEYFLTQNPDGLYTAALNDGYPLVREAAKLTLAVPESLVYLEGIDPATGEALEETGPRGASEFFAALAAAQTAGAGFDSLNVDVTFGADGELAQVERFYTPWQ